MSELSEILDKLSLEDRKIVSDRLKSERKNGRAIGQRFSMVHGLLRDLVKVKDLDSLLTNVGERVVNGNFHYDSFAYSVVEKNGMESHLVTKVVVNPELTPEEKTEAIAQDAGFVLLRSASRVEEKVLLRGHSYYKTFKDGDIAPLKLKGMKSYITSPLRDEDGKNYGLITLGKRKLNGVSKSVDIRTVEDIAAVIETATQEIKYKSTLRDLARKFKLLSENSTAVLFGVKPNGTFDYITPSVQNVLGYDPTMFATQAYDGGMTNGLVFESLLPDGSEFDAHFNVERNREKFHEMFNLSDPKPGRMFKVWLNTNGKPCFNNGLTVKDGVPALVSISYTDEVTDKKYQGINGILINETQALGSLVPTCSGCNAVRIGSKEDTFDPESWVSFTDYMTSLGAKISHGYCPDCAEKLFPGYKL